MEHIIADIPHIYIKNCIKIAWNSKLIRMLLTEIRKWLEK